MQILSRNPEVAAVNYKLVERTTCDNKGYHDKYFIICTIGLRNYPVGVYASKDRCYNIIKEIVEAYADGKDYYIMPDE